MKKNNIVFVFLIFFIHNSLFSQTLAITAIEPLSGIIGTEVIIRGENFSLENDGNIVFFGSIKASIVSSSSNEIRVLVPKGSTNNLITVLDKNTHLQVKSLNKFSVLYPIKLNIETSDLAGKVSFPLGKTPQFVKTGDLDGDGRPDVVVPLLGENTISIFKNVIEEDHITTNAFVKSIIFTDKETPSWVYPTSIELSDLNGDGKPDIISCTSEEADISVFQNESNLGVLNENSFKVAKFKAVSGIVSIASGDVDEDGKDDIVAVNSLGVYFFKNTSTITTISFAPVVQISATYGLSKVFLRDMDGDGKLDIIALNANNKVSFWKNVANQDSSSISYFNFGMDLLTEKAPKSLEIEDLNGDNKPDILIGYDSNTDFNISIYKNTMQKGVFNNSSFATKKNYEVFGNPGEIALVDLNGDGKMDIFTPTNGNYISILQNNSKTDEIDFGTRIYFYPNSSTFKNIDIADFNLDGKPDILLGSYSNDIIIYENISGNKGKSPVITSAFPAVGGSGSVIKLKGAGFLNTIQVKFGDIVARGFKIESDSTIMAVVDNGADGNFSLTTLYGTASVFGFNYVAAPEITYSSNRLFMPPTKLNYSLSHNFIKGVPINPLTPIHKGGQVPELFYGTVRDVIGSLQPGFTDGKLNEAKFNGLAGVVVDLDGNIFVADSKNNSIRKITKDGIVSTIAGSLTAGYEDGMGDVAKFNNPKSLAVSKEGVLYVADAGNNCIRKITKSGEVSTIAGDLTAGYMDGLGESARFNYPVAISIDQYENLYIADQNNNVIRLISKNGTVSTLAGDLNAGKLDARGKLARFNKPSALAVDALSNVYVADAGNNLIRKIKTNGDVVTVAGSGASGNADGNAQTASFKELTGVCIDTCGNIFVTEKNQIRVINKNEEVELLAGSEPPGEMNGIGSEAKFLNLSGLTSDGKGHILVINGTRIRQVNHWGYKIQPNLPRGLSMSFNGEISGTPIDLKEETDYKVSVYNKSGFNTNVIPLSIIPKATLTPSFKYDSPFTFKVNHPIDTVKPEIQELDLTPNHFGETSTFAGTGMAGIADGPIDKASFSGNMGMVTDKQGNIYVADAGNNLIRKIATDGEVTTIAGNGKPGTTNGTGKDASFKNPSGITVDSAGNIYVADAGNHLIRKIDTNGIVTTLAGKGSAGYTEGNDVSAEFSGPSALAVDSKGNIFVADTYNSRIRMITPNGVVSTIIQDLQTEKFNGPGTTTSNWYPKVVYVDNKDSIYVGASGYVYKVFRNGFVTKLSNDYVSIVSGITQDSVGNFFVSGSYHTIYMITIDGKAHLIAGKESNEGLINGPGLDARFKKPSSVCWKDGYLYVGDQGNNLIRKIETLGFYSDPLPDGLKFNSSDGSVAGIPTTLVKGECHNVYKISSSQNILSGFCISVIENNQNLPPVINSVSSLKGSVGSFLTLNGLNFNPLSNLNTVYFGQAKGKVISGTSENLLVEVPPGASYSKVSLTNTENGLIGYSQRNFTPVFLGKKDILPEDFDPEVIVPLGSGNVLYDIKLADFDGDGKVDILISFMYHVKVLQNVSKDGKITPESFVEVYDFDEEGYGDLVVKDFDGDGRLDFGMANQVKNTFSVFRNKSIPGSFSFVKDVTLSIANVYAIASADLDNDGKTDVCLTTFPTSRAYIVANNSIKGKISFKLNNSYSIPNTPSAITIADLDADGKEDIAITAYSENKIVLLKNISSTLSPFSFQNINTALKGTENIETADLDGDNKLDLIVDENFTMKIYNNVSEVGKLNDNSFQKPLGYLENTYKYSIETADMNGDGKVDMIVNDYQAPVTNIFRNIGEKGNLGISSFAPPISFKSETQTMRIGDLDGDGLPDLIYAGYNTINIIKNNPKPQLQLLELGDSTIYKFSPTHNKAKTIDSTVTVSYTGSIQQANISLGNFTNGEDNLVFEPNETKFGNIEGLYDDNTGTLVLTSLDKKASLQQWEQAIRSVQYFNSNITHPNLKTRVIEYLVKDDTFNSTPVSKEVILEFETSPTIFDIDRNRVKKGSRVEIFGEGFINVSSVKFGGVEAESFKTNKSDWITAIVYDGASGDVSVSAPNGDAFFKEIVFIPKPSIIAEGPTAFYIGDSVKLKSNITGDYNYQWTKDGVDIIGENAKTYIAKETGNYTLKIVEKDFVLVSEEINIKNLFTLPDDNFVLNSSPVTCVNDKDGLIEVNAKQSLNYNINILGNMLDTVLRFNSTVSINNLIAGNYKLCLTVEGKPEYERCFEMEVSSPELLKVTSTFLENQLVLKMYGAGNYTISNNGKEYSVNSQEFTLPLTEGENRIKIVTDKPCQGVFEDIVYLDALKVYPNPFTGIVNISIATNEEQALVEVYAFDGSMKYQKTHLLESGKIAVDLRNLMPGIYFIKIRIGNKSYTSKLVKIDYDK